MKSKWLYNEISMTQGSPQNSWDLTLRFSSPPPHTQVDGIVKESLPNAKFRVELVATKAIIVCSTSGKMRKNFVRVLVGDPVKVSLVYCKHSNPSPTVFHTQELTYNSISNLCLCRWSCPPTTLPAAVSRTGPGPVSIHTHLDSYL